MRGNMMGLLVVALMSVSSGAGAIPIVYNVNISDGAEAVTGTITTDGAIGAIAAADISAWSLTASGSIAFTSSSLDPGAFAQCDPVFGCATSASATTLVFFRANTASLNFGSNAGFFQFFGVGNTATSGLYVHLMQPSIATYHMNVPNLPPPDPLLIGTAAETVSVPEPPTATLLGLALACLGFARKRPWGRQSAAV